MKDNFTEILRKLLKKHLDELVFLELKDSKIIAFEGLSVPDKITLPVYVYDLANKIKENDIDKIPVIAIIKGLVYTVGANAEKVDTEFYKALLLKIDKDVTLSILQDGIRLAEEKHYPQAILYFNAAINLEHKNLDAWYNMGRCFEDLSNLEERPELMKLSKYCYEQCLTIMPDFAQAHFNLGVFYYNQESYQLAEEHWMKAVNLDLPDGMKSELISGLGKVRDRAAFEKGYELILAGRVEEGHEILKTLEDFHDEWWDLLFFIGLGYRMLEQYEDALNYFLKVMNLNTGHIQTMNEIGICLLSLGDLDEAIRYYKEAIRLSPENAELLCNLGIVYLNKGMSFEARNFIEKAHDLAPDDEVVQMWISHIRQTERLN